MPAVNLRPVAILYCFFAQQRQGNRRHDSAWILRFSRFLVRLNRDDIDPSLQKGCVQLMLVGNILGCHSPIVRHLHSRRKIFRRVRKRRRKIYLIGRSKLSIILQ